MLIILKKFYEQILYKPDLKLSFPNGCVMCTMLLIEVWVNRISLVHGLMLGGVSSIVSSVTVTCKEVTSFGNETYSSFR